VRSQWQVWRADYRWAWSRYVVKILNAKALMPRFEEAFEQDAGIVYATRHPIPAALSVIRQGWGLTAEAFLDDDRFRESHLAPTTVVNARRILHEGTLLERHVLNWCLENLLPLQRWQSSNWFTISFERLVGFPHESAARIVRFAQAGVEADVLTALSRPTRTTSRSSKGSIATSGPESRIEAWRSQVGPDDIRRVGKLLAMFEVDLYNPNETQPLQAFDGIS
jgi:hypothetical protein